MGYVAHVRLYIPLVHARLGGRQLYITLRYFCKIYKKKTRCKIIFNIFYFIKKNKQYNNFFWQYCADFTWGLKRDDWFKGMRHEPFGIVCACAVRRIWNVAQSDEYCCWVHASLFAIKPIVPWVIRITQMRAYKLREAIYNFQNVEIPIEQFYTSCDNWK